MPKEVHERLMKGLRRVLTEEQVEQILDKYTVGKVAFTMKGYQEIVPDMTEEETAFILEQLKLAREQAVDYKSMKQISAIFKGFIKRRSNCISMSMAVTGAKCIKTMQKSERRKKQRKGNRASKILFINAYYKQQYL